MGAVQLVVDIEIDPTSKAVYLSTWMPTLVKKVVRKRMIIDRDLVRGINGNACKGI